VLAVFELCWPHVRDALHGELDRDFVKLPVREIEKHLAA
jgi:protein required for attachment to host cells